MERIPRDCKKLKLAGPGKPDLNMLLSTMAKFRGGTNSSSPSLSLSSPFARAFGAGDGDLSFTAQIPASEFSSFMADFGAKI